MFLGLVGKNFGLIHARYSSPKWQAVKLTFFAPWGAYLLTEKSGWGVDSIMVSDLPVYRRNTTTVTL